MPARGSSFAAYEIWDGIRAVDYLLTRKEVDRRRIGVAGSSGGGTQAGYLMALDTRLSVGILSCWMTPASVFGGAPGRKTRSRISLDSWPPAGTCRIS